MNLRTFTTARPQTGPRAKPVLSSKLLAAGDRVMIPAEDNELYRIVHISEHKAWVCPIIDGPQRIVRTGELRLVEGSAPGSVLLS